MALTWPRIMPEIGGNAISFEPALIDYMSPETGGRIGAVAAGFPLWRMRLGLANLDDRDSDIWRAFIVSLRGPRRLFLARDLNRSDRPRLPRRGPYSKVAADWSQTINDDGDALLSLSGLLVGMPLSIGDYIGFRWDAEGSDAGTFDRRTVARVVEPGIADTSGEVTVTVEPPIPPLVPVDAQVHFDKPSCLMRLVPGQYQLGEQVLGGYTAQGGSIEAVQELLP